MTKMILIGLAVAAIAGTAFAQQQPSAITRTALHKVEFPDGRVTVSGRAELPAGVVQDDAQRGGAKVMAARVVDNAKPLASPAS